MQSTLKCQQYATLVTKKSRTNYQKKTFSMNPELERKVEAYAHDYRDMNLNEEALATMLRTALTEAYELGRKEEDDAHYYDSKEELP